jgi:large subunit ribosomal protein L23
MNLTVQDVIVRPIISEKAERGREAERQYAFQVHRESTKIQVKGAVEKLFSVKVGRRPNWKKAIVTLKEGDTIALFEGK